MKTFLLQPVLKIMLWPWCKRIIISSISVAAVQLLMQNYKSYFKTVQNNQRLMLKQNDNSSDIVKKSFIRKHLDLLHFSLPKAYQIFGGGAGG